MGESRKIGDVQPFAELARGSTTTVYKAHQASLNRTVLLKVLHPEHAADAEVAGNFEAEARLAARVQHANVVSVFDFGREGDQHYVITEFVEGKSLAGLLDSGRLPVNLALYILKEVSRGLKAVHGKGIIHRDIKPSNILLANDGTVKVADFGMASLLENTSGSDARGTLAYMPPELLRGQAPTPVSDLFSLGATLLEMITGRPAFSANDASGLMDIILHEDPLPILKMVDISPRTRRLIQMLLKKKPADRYESLDVMLRDLQQVQKTEGRASSDDLRQYMADPEAYRQKQREQEDAALPAIPAARKKRAAKPAPKTSKPRQKFATQRFVRIALVLLLLVGGGFIVNAFMGSGVFVNSGSVGSGNSSVSSSSPASSRQPSSTPSQERQTAEASPGESETQADQQEPPAESATDEANTAQGAGPANEADGLQGTDEEASLTSERIAMGQLRVVAEPWAAVFVDADSIGPTPVSLPLPVGSYIITLRKPGFPDYQRDVVIDQGEETMLRVPLWDYVAKVSVAVVPWADVYLDGVYQDQTPLDQPLIVSAGRHTLLLKHPQLGEREEEFLVRAGEVKTLRFNMQR